MNKRLKYVKIVVLIAVSTILLAQGLWIYNMYQEYLSELDKDMAKALETASHMELAERHSKLGGYVFFKMSAFSPEDYKRGFIIRKITTPDSTFFVKVNPRDPDAEKKILQLLMKNEQKVDLQLLDSLFVSELEKRDYQINASYIEYFDLKNNKLLDNNKTQKWHYYSCSTDTVPLDIIDSIGVKAYVSSKIPLFLSRMLFQLILSAILIALAYFCLFYLLSTIFTQRKVETMRQDMINAMTHEFKRPIANSRVLLDMAKLYIESDDLEKAKSNIDKADFQLERLRAYKEQILEINRNEYYEIQLNLTPISIPDFIKVYTENYKDIADIQINIKTSREVFVADKLHFTNVIENLVENAIKYSEERAKIIISIYDKGSKMFFSVKDHGIGIASSEKNHIFEKFYRVNNKKVLKKDGFGLGLAYAKSVIEAHHGHIMVESEPDAGSTFYVEIPL